MKIDIIIASTSRFKKYGSVARPEEADDLSGMVILEKIRAAGHDGTYRLLPDGIDPIRSAVDASSADAIIICGGTGLTHLDLTLEALEPIFEKDLPGFGEIFRLRSLEEVGTRAMLTRAAAGVIRNKPVFCIPGSPNAARLGADLILAELLHIITHIFE
jgi:molybdenum cofactor biosynthesis protein B